jgi:hypothetical protein
LFFLWIGFSWISLGNEQVEKLSRDKENMKRLLDKDMVYEKYLLAGLTLACA